MVTVTRSRLLPTSLSVKPKYLGFTLPSLIVNQTLLVAATGSTQRNSGLTLDQIADLFAQSAEFQRRYGSVSNVVFLQIVYQKRAWTIVRLGWIQLLAQPAQSGFVEGWSRALDSSQPRIH